MRTIVPIAVCGLVLISQALAGAQETAKDTKSQKEKVSYSLGYETGRSMKNKSVDLDPDVFIRAFKEGFAGDKAAMTNREMRDCIELLKKETVRQAQEIKKSPEKSRELAEKNKKESEAFLAENAKKDGIVTLPSGLQYKIITEGAGKQPAKTDRIQVHYRGTLIDGTEFDNSYKRGKPAVLGVVRTIKGWTEGVLLMKEGAKWTLYIPSELAYGERGLAVRGKTRGSASRQIIGPNQALIFEVELISILSPEQKKEGTPPATSSSLEQDMDNE